MTKTELREYIKVLHSTIEVCELSIRTWRERGDKQFYTDKLTAQDAIIAEAEAKKRQLTEWHETSDAEIKRLKTIVDYKRKQLAEAENRRSIEKLLETYKQLNELEEKETDDDDEVDPNP
jgi:hypothetical protein